MKGLITLISLLTIVFPSASFANEMKLDWKFKYKYEKNYNSDHREVSFKIVKVTTSRDKLLFDVVAHNTHKSWYQCIYITASENSVHIDDDLANEYSGATVTFKNGHDNKLALNQRKKFTISIPRPEEEADLANVHFGLFSTSVESEKNCDGPISKSWGYNFHQYDWNIAPLRRK